MALGFIKKVFTFGKEKPIEQQAPEGHLTPTEAAAIEAEVEPHSREEDLPVSPVDPVAPVEMETAGGPAADDARDVVEPVEPEPADEEPSEEELPPLLPGAEENTEIGIVPLPLLEAESEAGTESSPVSEPVLPKGFTTRVDEVPEPEVVAPRMTWYQRLRAGLARTSSQITGQITALFTKRKLDEETLEDLEDLLIQSDLGVETAMRITGALSAERYGKDVTGEDVSRIMAAEISKVLSPGRQAAATRPQPQAARHPGGRRQWHGQDHHHRQACREAVGVGAEGHVGRRRYVPCCRNRTVEDLGGSHWFRNSSAPSLAPMPPALPTTPSNRRGRRSQTC
jgi:fused signal recognition particle receptor